MKSLIWKLVDFDPAVETWEHYAEWLQHFQHERNSRWFAQKVYFIVSIDSQELQVTSQSTKPGAAEGQIIHTDCWGAA